MLTIEIHIGEYQKPLGIDTLPFIISCASASRLLILLSACVSLSGCLLDNTKTPSLNGSGIQTPTSSRNDRLGWLGKKYARNPANKTIALEYVDALSRAGRDGQSLAVVRRLTIAHPSDRQILAVYGKTLAKTGQYEMALDAIRRAQTPDMPDWTLFSAEAAALDALNRGEEARIVYKRALKLAPKESSILSNMAMSYLMDGQSQNSEKLLKYAYSLNTNETAIRQNLALVYGLQGNFEEAKKLYANDLKPDQVEDNLRYLAQMRNNRELKK